MMRAILLFILLISGCSGQPAATTVNDVSRSSGSNLIEGEDSIHNRDVIREHLNNKVKSGEPLVIHVFVPLCDNANQGIVPVSEKLGDGRNLMTNLYWGALYGVKTHFQRTARWKVLSDQHFKSGPVLERIVFFKHFPNGAKVFIVADAYAGDKMYECLDEYLRSLAGRDSAEIKVTDTVLNAYGKANLLVFNGHNGLMEHIPRVTRNIVTGYREAVTIACATRYYFPQFIARTGAYALLGTNKLLAPEAYVLEAVINSWSNLESAENIRLSASKAYHKYQDCGWGYANELFHTGW